MTSKERTKKRLCCWLAWVLAVSLSGCMVIGISSCGDLPGRFERTEQSSAPLETGLLVVAQTHNGSITVRDTQSQQCFVEARIKVRARTDELAQQIAQQIEIKLDQAPGKLTIRLEKPKQQSEKYHVTVDYDIKIPRENSLQLASHNGNIDVSHIAGDVKGTTHNGLINAKDISGNVELQSYNGHVSCQSIGGRAKLTTHNGRVKLAEADSSCHIRTYNGSVHCHAICGDADIETHNGSIKVVYDPHADPAPNVRLTTYNNNIDLTPPADLSATVELATYNGTINSDLPVVVQGPLARRTLNGTIGTGQGRLHLATHNGSVHLGRQ